MQLTSLRIHQVRRNVPDALRRPMMGGSMKTIAMILGVGILGIIVAGGLFTVVVGISNAIAESTRTAHEGHAGRFSFNH